ncbi:hypothetical protein [Kitasatospora sp. NBC_00315]|uniref:hypothetical protein n=1 Tax=Kitasatospora sp. NBC_00315 TaxID=2975963 RepID=UPI003250B98A
MEIRVPVRIAQSTGGQRVEAALPFLLRGIDTLVDELNATHEKHGTEAEYAPFGKGDVDVPETEREKTPGVHSAAIDHDAAALADRIHDLLVRP